jgi:hypothetical protein
VGLDATRRHPLTARAPFHHCKPSSTSALRCTRLRLWLPTTIHVGMKFHKLRCNNFHCIMHWQYPQDFLQIWSVCLILKIQFQPCCRGVKVNSRHLNDTEECIPWYPLGGREGGEKVVLLRIDRHSTNPTARQFTDGYPELIRAIRAML